uniref:C1q domain-containing protein n=1 Tax=Magallana gigas TaxID=29159 RepID=A0A8W8JH95_MAGGI
MSQLSLSGNLFLFAVFVWGVSSRQFASRLDVPTRLSTSTPSTSARPSTYDNFFTNRWITTTTKGPAHPYPATSPFMYNYLTNQWITSTRTTHPQITIPNSFSKSQWIGEPRLSPTASQYSTTAAEKLLPNDATLLHQILIQETSLRVELQKTVWDLMKEVEQMKKNQMEEKSKQDIVNQQLINNITLLRSENKKLRDELSVVQQQAQNKSSNSGLHSYHDFTNVSKELQNFKREFRYFSLGFLDIQQDIDRINTQQENVTTAIKDMLVKVAFTATRTLSQSFTTETAVVFSNIPTNIGGGYNAVTGIFTAPLGGIYLFDCKLTDNQNRDGTSIFFVKNGAYQGSHVGNDGPTNLFRSSSSSIVLELIPGDMVWLKVYGVSSFHTKTIIGEQILTGFLL